MRRETVANVVIVITAIAFVSCGKNSSNRVAQHSRDVAMNTSSRTVAVSGGVRCSMSSGARPDLGPPSFLVRDLGKPGVPDLSAEQMKLLLAVERNLHSPTLRFLFARSEGDHSSVPEFVVFDAIYGACSTITEYQVLNGDCNELWDTTESAIVSDMDCFDTPPPWPHGRYPSPGT
jgi:hypothetical protein